MGWAVREMSEMIDLREYIQEELGLKCEQKGATLFTECLSTVCRHAGHTKLHAAVDQKNLLCYSCHVNYDTDTADGKDRNDIISVTRMYARVNGQDASFNAACEKMFLYLCRKHILSPEDRERLGARNSSDEMRELFPYSVDELKAAGFSTDYKIISLLREMYAKDSKFVNSLVLSSLEKTIEKLSKIVTVSCDYSYIDEAETRLRKADKLYEKLTGKKRVRSL